MEKEDSTLAVYRWLRLLHIEICWYFKQMEECGLKNKSVLVTLLWKALNIIEVELEVVKVRIEHYGLAPESPKVANDAPVYWSEEYTVTDLMELIEAMYKSGVLVYRDGRRVSRAALVRLFERTFNIEIKDARGLKRNVTTRKIKTTSFLNILSANFIELRNS